MSQVAPKNALQQAYEEARQFDGAKQEFLGQVLASATRGENLSPLEIEHQQRNQQTLQALQDIEDGNVMTEEEFRASMKSFRQSLKT